MTLSGSILIIEDEAALCQSFARILRQTGCHVTTAADGDEALRYLKTAPFNLAYLDIHLPGRSGLEVLKEINQHYPEMPVIFLTAHATVHSAVEAMRLGALDYLIKPIAPEALVDRTAAVLAEQTVQRRRRELRSQISALQEELRGLEAGQQPAVSEAGQSASDDRYLRRGPLVLDLQVRRASLNDQLLDLPPAAFDYLVVLARRAPAVVDYQTLVTEAQGYQSDRREAQDLAKWHIHTLREVLEPDPRVPRYVLNVRGVGYQLALD